MLNLYEKLVKYSEEDVYPFHMPGHKRLFGEGSLLPYKMDITEISGFDNLHAPEEGGILWEIYEEARKCYKTVCSIPLVNGSTCGIMAAISSCVQLQDEIIMARNCHKSVYRTCELLGLTPHYLYPEYNEEIGIFTGINLEELEDMLWRYPDSKAVVITSPTYEGVILDVHQISEMVHAHNMILIVDEAHGAHLPFAQREKSAIANGADLVIQSLHKTLPALTQTAMLHFCEEGLKRQNLSLDKVKEFVTLYQSSSPSYVLMASIAECLNACQNWEKQGAFEKFYENIDEKRKAYRKLKYLRLLSGEEINAFDYDSSRFVVVCSDAPITGEELFERLRDDYQIECEMASLNYVTAIVSICDSEEGLKRLYDAILDMDQRFEQQAKEQKADAVKGKESRTEPKLAERTLPRPEAVMSLREAMQKQTVAVDASKLKFQIENDYVKTSTLPFAQVYHNAVAGSYVMVYPPGIPLIAPGEEYTKEILAKIMEADEQGLTVIGLQEGRVKVIC